MDLTYEEQLKYNIFAAIKMRSKKKEITEQMSREDLFKLYFDFPTHESHNPLLLNEDWLEENIEEILISKKFDYQNYQEVEEYLAFFRTVIKKYNVQYDYDRYLNNQLTKRELQNKWHGFAIEFVDFFRGAQKNIVRQLFYNEEFKNYFLSYPAIYTKDVLENFGDVAMSILLKSSDIANLYIQNPRDLLYLIRKYINIEIPEYIMNDSNVIKKISHNPNTEYFYYDLFLVEEQTDIDMYIKEHKSYCDKQIDHTKDGILPCLKKEYISSENKIEANIHGSFSGDLKTQVTNRIFALQERSSMSKKDFYQELSKYIVVSMFISRHFEKSPYNTMIDIKTLFDFTSTHNRKLIGCDIYKFLLDYENKTIFEVIEFYQKTKSIPIKKIFEHDWQNQVELFVNEINKYTLDSSDVPRLEGHNEVFDITNYQIPILVHNTSVPINKPDAIKELIDRVINAKASRVCLSLQDYNHQVCFHKESINQPTIKFIYGKLDSDKVQIVNHCDAYSINLDHFESEDSKYIRRLYTLKTLMDNTNPELYNEIVYNIEERSFMPIGVLCDNEITQEELEVAKVLGVDVYYRKTHKPNIDFKEDEKLRVLKPYCSNPNTMSIF